MRQCREERDLVLRKVDCNAPPKIAQEGLDAHRTRFTTRPSEPTESPFTDLDLPMASRLILSSTHSNTSRDNLAEDGDQGHGVS